MKFRLGAMSVGDIFDRGLKLLFSRFATFYAINLVVGLPLIAFYVFTTFSAVSVSPLAATAIREPVNLILTFIGMAAVLKVVEQEYIGRKIGIGAALGFAMRRFAPLMIVSLIFGLGFCVGLFLLVIPGLIFLCMYSFAGQAVVLEGDGPIAGMNRSAKLTRGYKWRIFGIFFLIGLLGSGIVWILNQVYPAGEIMRDADGTPRLPNNETGQIIRLFVRFLIGTLFNTYASICLVLAYFDLRTRKEGFDLELAAQGLSQTSRGENDDDRDERRPSRD